MDDIESFMRAINGGQGQRMNLMNLIKSMGGQMPQDMGYIGQSQGQLSAQNMASKMRGGSVSAGMNPIGMGLGDIISQYMMQQMMQSNPELFRWLSPDNNTRNGYSLG